MSASYVDVKRKLFGTRRTRECHYCGKRMTFDEATVDHAHPVALGGGKGTTNSVLACRACNDAKGSMPYDEFVLRHVKGSGKP